ncbi:MAG: kdo(2)-lipid A phosphoethanolamine 7''-transferase [Betaproteobacteria bacterium]
MQAWHFLIGACSIYVALLFNAVEAFRRFSAQQSNGGYAWSATGLELLLALSGTAALFYIASLFGRVAFKSVVALVLIFSAVSVYYMAFFHVVIGYGIVQATLTTDVDLSKEAIGAGVLVFVLLLGVVPAIAVATTTLAPGARRSRLAMSVAACALCWLVIHTYPLVTRDPAGNVREKSASPLGVVVHSYVPSNWITGVAMSALSKFESVVRREQLTDPAQRFAYRMGTNLDDTFLVIVIGESARYDRMGVLGHSRPNTPEMAKTDNLAAMRATSCNTSTRLSLQCMFVRPGAVDDGGASGRQTVSEEMVFTVLKKLGFTSELFAMQGEVWFYNSVNPDYYKHREIIYAREENIGKPVDDLLLLRELEESIASHPRGKHLVVLHTKGSHFSYTQRYPRAYAWYTPECLSVESPCEQQALLNSYDNSIAYTDYFLSRIIRQMESRKAMVIYTSDHGESIEEAAHLHGTPKHMAPPEQRMVPLMFWASKPLLSQDAHARRFARLDVGEGSLASHEFLFDSILGCLGIESDNGGINQAWNLCAERAIPVRAGEEAPSSRPSLARGEGVQVTKAISDSY